MPERFTPEYIKFAGESELIQAAWQKRGVQAGDYCIGQNKLNQGLVGIVLWHKTKSADAEFGYVGGWAVSELIEGDLHWYCNKPKHIMEDWLWIPTLSDLWNGLEDNLEEFVLECRRKISIDAGRKVVRSTVATRPWLPDESTHDDIELAAARLLDCVLAGKEGQ